MPIRGKSDGIIVLVPNASANRMNFSFYFQIFTMNVPRNYLANPVRFFNTFWTNSTIFQRKYFQYKYLSDVCLIDRTVNNFTSLILVIEVDFCIPSALQSLVQCCPRYSQKVGGYALIAFGPSHRLVDKFFRCLPEAGKSLPRHES